jgi:lysophospholipase L1-like esterase
MLGDSLTEQGDWSRRFPTLHIRNRGVGGEGVNDLLRRLDRVAEERPAAVFLMVGVNDLKVGTPPAAVLDGIRAISSRLRGAWIPVVFQSTLYIDPARRPDINDSIRALNDQIRVLAREAAAPFIDLNAALAPAGRLAPEVSRDGLHLTASGYAAWVRSINPCIRGVASSRSTEACGRPLTQ